MRRTFLALVGFVVVISFAGCIDHAQPLAPSEQRLTLGTHSDVRATTSIQNEFVPLDLDVFVPCAAGGLGEWVSLTGQLHVLTRVTENGAGYHFTQHFQPQGVSGIGAVTGASYRGTGATHEQFNANVGSAFSYVNNFRIVGQGRGNNWLVHDLVHVTVNANALVTTVVEEFSAECR